MVGAPYTLTGREIAGLAAHHRSEVPPSPCIFCGRAIRHVNDDGTGRLLGAVVDGESRTYLRCNDGPCARTSAPWVWRCGCARDYVENVGGRCHSCRRPRSEAEPYDRVECPACGAARWLDDRRGIGNGRCLSCTGGPAYLPVLYEAPAGTPLAILPASTGNEIVAHAPVPEGRPIDRRDSARLWRS
jgi:hypothetical protein